MGYNKKGERGKRRKGEREQRRNGKKENCGLKDFPSPLAGEG
jgi:hypothetical protein